MLIGITCGGTDLVSRVVAALDAGADVLVRELEISAGLPLDRVILHARMPGAEQVARALHLSSDMQVAEVRRRFRGRLGYSAHTREDADRAYAAGADYVFLSPVFGKGDVAPIGLADVAGCVALGGVTPARMRACLDAGAIGVAAMRGIFGAEDVAAAVRDYART